MSEKLTISPEVSNITKSYQNLKLAISQKKLVLILINMYMTSWCQRKRWHKARNYYYDNDSGQEYIYSIKNQLKLIANEEIF